MKSCVALLIVCLAWTPGGAASRARQDPKGPDYYGSMEFLKTLSVEELQYSLEFYRRQLPSAVRTATDDKGKWFANGYLESLKKLLDLHRAALGEKGVDVRPTWEQAGVDAGEGAAVAETAAGAAGAGGNTLKNIKAPKGNTMKVPKPGGGTGIGPAYALPTLILLTTVQIAECSSRGVDVKASAREVATFAAGGALLGTIIAVAAPPAVATGAMVIATVMTVGTTVINVVEAGIEGVRAGGAIVGEMFTDAERRDAMKRNADAMTPGKMAAAVASFRGDLEEVNKQNRATTEFGYDLDNAVVDLNIVVDRVRNTLEALKTANESIAAASSRCADPDKNPVAFVVDAEGRVKTLAKLADGIVDASTRAVTLAASCSTAAEAKRLYAQAARDKAELDHTRLDAGADLRDAAVFFTVVKAGRAALTEANKLMATLDADVTKAREAGKNAQEAISKYRTLRDQASRSQNRLGLAVKALHSAFSDPPPAHVAAGLREIDAMEPVDVVDYSNDDLRHFLTEADANVNRVEGLVRAAKNDLKNLKACENIADELPDPLKKEMALVNADLVKHWTRGDAAFKAAKEVPAKVDACATAKPAGADGTLTGKCTGTITALPEEGKPGTPLRLRVQIAPPHAADISRVIVDNPGCNDPRCRDTRWLGDGGFEITLAYQASMNAASINGVIARFRVKFQAFKDAELMCTGQSKELRVLAR